MEEPSPGAGLDDEVTLKTFGKADMFVLSKHFKPKQKKTSIYTGVTYHKTACKWEAHLWDATIVRQDCIRTGTQIYLGAWETERRAAMAYDLLAIKYWGADTKKVNFESSSYQQDSQLLRGMSKTDATKTIRRHAPSFNSGNCNFRGVTRAPKLGAISAQPFQHNAGLVWSLQLCTKAASSQMGEYISSGRVAYKLGDDGSGTMPLEPCSPGRMFDADHSNKYIRALMYAQLSC
ncbi:hypothetical protein WJX73_009111 [Symbiochloris irregularis]|uniref:AP2/ERF domain-containing protein n=1 Tax=Symbiochloris irregularis TaxID=706552 RepID=A0AAW1PXC1_9CHLO